MIRHNSQTIRQRGRSVSGLLIAAVILCSSGAAIGQDSTTSIEEFLSRKEQWNALVGATFHLEGRIGSTSTTSIQFKRCDLDFRLKPGQPALPRDTVVAEVKGSLVREGGGFYFEVSELRKRDNDKDTLARMQVDINSTVPQNWYKLADWAEGRGTFYQDVELRNKAADYREIGLMTELRRTKAGDVDALLDLAKRAKDLKLDETLGWRFIHSACRLEMARLRRETKADDSVLLNRIRTELSGSTEPLTPDDAPLRESYAANPDAVYIAADTNLRKKLHRALYSEVLLARIERDAKSDGSNGDAIAGRIAQQLPELTTVVKSYREKEIAYLAQRVGSLSRDQLLELAKKYRALDRSDDAKRVTQEWLKSQESSRRLEGPQALIALGEDYRVLLNDQKTAQILVEEAWRANPQADEAKTWLKERGFVLHNGTWMDSASMPSPDEDPFEAAIQEGRVIAGMTASQVRQSLGENPSSVVRSASRSSVNELWIYKPHGLVVTLTRQVSQKEPVVDEVNSITQ